MNTRQRYEAEPAVSRKRSRPPLDAVDVIPDCAACAAALSRAQRVQHRDSGNGGITRPLVVSWSFMFLAAATGEAFAGHAGSADVLLVMALALLLLRLAARHGTLMRRPTTVTQLDQLAPVIDAVFNDWIREQTNQGVRQLEQWQSTHQL